MTKTKFKWQIFLDLIYFVASAESLFMKQKLNLNAE